ncbi:hypothetical protein AB0Y04_02630 [Loigolactobacillus coryniformis]|uniref:hypothetical protein n=1 Tax=Loigolactobacillus coryniformis TaxID=1610 RepID=UPI00201AC7F5|nr:hypothetical protein [Loigolactobacillus coryniformis]
MSNLSRFQWLQEYSQLEHDIKFLEWNIRKSEHEYQRWAGGDLTNVRIVKESKAAHLEEDIDSLQRELEWRRQALSDLLELIDSFDGIEEQILRKKYIEGESLEQIASDNDVHYALSYIQKKHSELHRRLNWLDNWDEKKYDNQVMSDEQLR